MAPRPGRARGPASGRHGTSNRGRWCPSRRGTGGRAPSLVKASSGKRYPSPRLNSPARGAGNENAGVQPVHDPSLRRSSSRKAEQSPYLCNPMAELDENALANHNSNIGKSQEEQLETLFEKSRPDLFF